VITDGGAASDSILTQYINSPSGVPGTELSVSGGSTMTTTQYNVRSSVAFAVADAVVPTTDCILKTVTSVASTAIGYAPTGTASANTGYLAHLGRTSWNGAGSPPAPPTLVDLVSRQYAIDATNNALTVGEYPAYGTTNLVDDVVFLKAEYGVAATSTGTAVSSWVSGTTAIDNSTTCTGATIGSACVIALRVGIVARSARAENETVDQPNPVTVLPAITGTVTAAAVTYTLPDAKYRYRGYSTIIPLRNVIWTR
jgi:type IV pilus assembly protein PilW